MSHKENLRDQYRRIREGLPASARKSAARKILAQLMMTLEFIGTKTVAVYVSKGSEVDTHSLIQALARKKIRIAAPKVVQNKLHFFPIRSIKDCAPGTFGVLEPKSSKAIDPKELDVILVPGIVFDSKGYRIGYGKGFYDQLLSALNLFNTIGLSYDQTLVPNLPRDGHDVPVNWLITPSRTLCLTHEQK